MSKAPSGGSTHLKDMMTTRPWHITGWVAGMTVFLAVCGGVAGNLLAADAAKPSPEPLDAKGVAFFESRIRPVLAKYCYECHSESSKKIKGNLRLDLRAGWQVGGDLGPVVEPGKPGDSLLMKAVNYTDPDMEMPPKGKLPDAVLADLTKWIEMGAPDPRDGEIVKKRGRQIDWEEGHAFWAYRKPVDHKPPMVRDTSWPRSDIDRFVLARLEKEGLAPVADADKRTMIRRVYYDLIGLPPTPEQIDAYLSDTSDDAWVKVVDELLASPHFGERWGRHWLDVARFAEASGGGRELIFNNAWRYRDYVIDAFNADKPYDEFVREQIAGDLLPHETDAQREQQLVATGYLELGPTNYELQDKELLRMEVIDEQIDVMGRSILAMTIGCARCHTHPFDPIPQEDYYALLGILRSTKVLTPGNVSGYVERQLPTPPAQQAALDKYDAEVNAINESIKTARAELKTLQRDGKASEKSTAKQKPADEPPAGIDSSTLPGIVVDDEDAALSGGWTTSTHCLPYVDKGYRYIRGNGTARYTLKVPKSGRYEVRIVYSPNPNRASDTPVEIHHADGVTTKQVNQQKVPSIDGVFESLGVYRFEKSKPAIVVIMGMGANGTVITDAVQLLPEGEASKPQPARVAKRDDTPKPDANADTSKADAKDVAKQIKLAEARIKRLEDDLKALKKSAPEPPPMAMSVHEQDVSEIGDYNLCIRGDVHSLGPVVPRGFLTVVTPGPAKIREGASGRLELAEWMTRPDNPLPARVMVNRIWLHLFGEGIVRTPDNFGHMGELPSHPQLLDHLAVEFMRDDWSVKRIIRQIVLSRVYAMSSTATSRRAELADPENRLLWRANRRRMDAEAIRDTMLMASGELDLTAGGPTMRNIKSSFGYTFTTKRRSVYVPVFRNTLHELMEMFDFADPNLVTGKRSTSTRPTQALYMMNSPDVMDHAKAAAERLLSVPGVDDGGRVELAYAWMLCRPPSESEQALALRFIESRAKSDAKDARVTTWAAFCQAMFASVDFRYLN
ncbi:MAG: DUF1553 domain-containing protein [Phycisphaera sp.]|nr:DUF1553 domain-containing protein [Phycisphaera sp.]